MGDIENLKCGILMPISKVSTNPEQYSEQHWEDVKRMITDAIEQTHLFTAVPVWEDNCSDQIKDTIYKNLISVDMAVCDISSLNANVMFELGLRLTLRKPVVIICDNQTNPPFDINDIRYVDPKYPVGLNLYKIPEFQKKLSDVILKTWERYKKDENNFTQLAQLKVERKALIVDETGKEIQYSDAIAEMLEMISSLSKNTAHKKNAVSSNMGTDILQFRADLQAFKDSIKTFVEKNQNYVNDDEIESFWDEMEVHMEDLDKFARKIEGEQY